MLGIAGSGDDRGHRRVAEEIFEEELRPARRVEIAGPFGQLLPAHRAEEPIAGERQIGQHCRADLGRGRDHPLLRRAIGERVIDLEKVRLLTRHHRLDGIEVAAKGGGDPDVAAETLRLPFAQYREILVRIADVV